MGARESRVTGSQPPYMGLGFITRAAGDLTSSPKTGPQWPGATLVVDRMSEADQERARSRRPGGVGRREVAPHSHSCG